MKQKKTISNSLAKISAAVFWVSACMVDSETWAPTIVCAISLGILLVTQRKSGRKRKWIE